MIDPSPHGVSRQRFGELSRLYRQRWRIALWSARPDGAIVLGRAGRGEESPAARRARQRAIAEALRWGEPTVAEYPAKRLIWAVPLMHNAGLLGGLIATVPERRALPDEAGRCGVDIRAACQHLRSLAEQANLTNAALLEARRAEYQREQKRAEAIQDVKTRYFYSIREVYLREEPALIAAVRKGDRSEARGILNRILLVIYTLGGENLGVIKSFLMELVVTLSRTAVESGGEPNELLGANYATLTELSRINTEQELSHWLVATLERIMDSIQRRRRRPSMVLLQAAMKHLAEHFAEDLSRDDVAKVAGLSPAHFSRLVRKAVGRSFSDLLNQLRIDRAVELLRNTDKGLLQIALEVGFNDQSYFTKVFRRYARRTPRQFRREQSGEPA